MFPISSGGATRGTLRSAQPTVAECIGRQVARRASAASYTFACIGAAGISLRVAASLVATCDCTREQLAGWSVAAAGQQAHQQRRPFVF